jgi:hypothetical protein
MRRRESIVGLDGAELRERARPALVRPVGEARLGHWVVPERRVV